MKIIDFHTHTFPDAIAAATVGRMSEKSGLTSFSDGSEAGLTASMRASGISGSVVLPVVTNPEKTAHINDFSARMNGKNGVFHLGGLHPDTPEIYAEARRCAEKGQFEIVLTGVHLGLFGRDSGETLAGLVRALEQVEGVKRLRFGSLEPFSIGEDLLEALAESKIFCRHLHLPVQSGDDAVLARMKRGHTVDDYLKLVSRLRAALGDDLHISTDVMCAFPGESEAAFAGSLALLDEARIGRVHAFRYSPRPGTPAAVMDGQIDGDIAKERMECLRRAAANCLEREARRWVGRSVEVLFEGEMRGYSQGYTREYIEFRPENASYYNQLRKITARSQNRGILSDSEG